MSKQFAFELCTYHDAIRQSRIFNINEIENILWLKIPDPSKYDSAHSSDLFLKSVYELNSTDEFVELDFTDDIERDSRRVWLKINTNMLNTSPGFHMYKFMFIDTRFNEEQNFFFAYKIQTDNPDKPYIYMNRGS